MPLLLSFDAPEVVDVPAIEGSSKHARRERELEALKRRREGQRTRGRKRYAVQTANKILRTVDRLAQKAGTYERPLSPREAKRSAANDPLLGIMARKYQVAPEWREPLVRVCAKKLSE